MKIVRIMLGLGNQMFQYAVYRTLQNNGDDVYLDISDYETHYVHNGYELPLHFNIHERIAPPEQINLFRKNILSPSIVRRILRKINKIFTASGKENQLNNPMIFTIKGVQFYQCYWVTEEYFNSIANILRSEFAFKNELDKRNRELLANMAQGNSVSIHIRRGTFIDHPIYGNICTIDYYKKAMEIMQVKVNDPVYYVFSEDIDWVKANLPMLKATFVDWNTGKNSYRDMQLMAGCKNNIIANSSFSWWAAWLNNNPEKLIIAPSKIFNIAENQGDGLIPKSWITVKV